MILGYFLPMHKKANSWQRLFLYRYQYECIFSVLFGGICHQGVRPKKYGKYLRLLPLGFGVQQCSIMFNMHNMQNMQNKQNMQNMQNMQNISPLFFSSKVQKSKISESESSINSRTCLGHLVLLYVPISLMSRELTVFCYP